MNYVTVNEAWRDRVNEQVPRSREVQHASEVKVQSAISLLEMMALDLEDDVIEARAGARRFDFGDAAPNTPAVTLETPAVVPKLRKKLDMVLTHLRAVKFDYMPSIGI